MLRREILKGGAAGMLLNGLRPLASLGAEIEGRWYQYMRPMMGTYVSLALHHDNDRLAEEISDGCFNYISGCIDQISNWDSRSRTCELNQNGILLRKSSSLVLQQLVSQAVQVKRSTYGFFNPCILALTGLWREAKAHNSIPDKIDLKYALKNVNSAAVEISKGEIRLHGKSALDFDGIGKGMLADLGCEYLKRQKIQFARISCWGDIRFLGQTEWFVTIEHPRSERPLGRVKVFGDVAISTSGDYRNSWFVNGKRYHHLIDPSKGWPSSQNMQATVVARCGAESDSFASALVLMNETAASKFLASNPQAQAVLIDSKGRISATQGVEFTPLSS